MRGFRQGIRILRLRAAERGVLGGSGMGAAGLGAAIGILGGTPLMVRRRRVSGSRWAAAPALLLLVVLLTGCVAPLRPKPATWPAVRSGW